MAAAASTASSWSVGRIGCWRTWSAGSLTATFVATKGFTVVDILMAHVLSAGIKDEGLIAPYPRIASYRDRCLARPAWKRTIEAYCARVEAG
jgi:glutathione S-transferase